MRRETRGSVGGLTNAFPERTAAYGYVHFVAGRSDSCKASVNAAARRQK